MKTLKTIEELFYDASNDKSYSYRLDRPGFNCYIYLGIKISKDLETGEIKIFNTHVGGLHYRELTGEQYNYFFIHGWTLGVYELVYSINTEKIARANEKLKNIVPNLKTDKLIKDLITTRDNRIEQQKVIIRRSCYFLKEIEKTPVSLND